MKWLNIGILHILKDENYSGMKGNFFNINFVNNLKLLKKDAKHIVESKVQPQIEIGYAHLIVFLGHLSSSIKSLRSRLVEFSFKSKFIFTIIFISLIGKIYEFNLKRYFSHMVKLWGMAIIIEHTDESQTNQIKIMHSNILNLTPIYQIFLCVMCWYKVIDLDHTF